MKFIFFICICLGISCGRDNKNIPDDIKYFYGETISYEGLCTIDEELVIDDSKSTFKIIHYIDSSQCVPCKLENLALWKKHEEELSKFNTEIILITNHPDQRGMGKLLENLQLSYPIYFDYPGDFKKQNHLPDSSIYRTFTVDKDNRVCWIGLPIQNEKSWTLYKRMLARYGK